MLVSLLFMSKIIEYICHMKDLLVVVKIHSKSFSYATQKYDQLESMVFIVLSSLVGVCSAKLIRPAVFLNDNKN